MFTLNLRKVDSERWYTLRNHDGSHKAFNTSNQALDHAESQGYFGNDSALDLDIVEIKS